MERLLCLTCGFMGKTAAVCTFGFGESSDLSSVSGPSTPTGTLGPTWRSVMARVVPSPGYWTGVLNRLEGGDENPAQSLLLWPDPVTLGKWFWAWSPGPGGVCPLADF